jgi:ABC-type multidrug transport system ATPase subunit
MASLTRDGLPLADLEVVDVVRDFGPLRSLDRVSLRAAPGEIHALLGPNGAGKTTLLRILAGLSLPTSGTVRLGAVQIAPSSGIGRRPVGLVPSGDRTFYLRLSGLENLVFFARLHGLRLGAARARSEEVLALVGLQDVGGRRAGEYSHGMQKRLSVARALLTRPLLLLVDEATHDLDPDGARIVRGLVRGIADEGTIVVWATQRLDEIRSFADRATVLDRGQTRFEGRVSELQAQSDAHRYLLQLQNGAGAPTPGAVAAAVGDLATVSAFDGSHVVLTVARGALLGEAIGALLAAHIDVLSCREDRSQIEDAFLKLTRVEA